MKIVLFIILAIGLIVLFSRGSKKKQEENKLAKTISEVSKLLKIIDNNSKSLLTTADRKQLLYIAYICKVGILDRLEKCSWLDKNSLIGIPINSFDKAAITIAEGLGMTMYKLSEIVSNINDIGLENKMTEIFEKGKLFYEIEKEIPQNMLDLMN